MGKWLSLFLLLTMVISCTKQISVVQVADINPILVRAAERPSYLVRYNPPTGDTMARAYRDLRARLERWGVTFVDKPFREVDGDTFGMTSRSKLAIYINPELDIDAQFEILAHEAAHLLQPAQIELVSHGEVFAELVAVGVCAYYGRDCTEAAVEYLCQYKEGFAVEPFLRTEIREAVLVLTGQRSVVLSHTPQR